VNERIKLDARYLTSKRNLKIFSAVFWCAALRLVLAAAAAIIVSALFRERIYVYVSGLSELPVLPVLIYCAAAALAAVFVMLSASAGVSVKGALRRHAEGREPRFTAYFTCARKRGLVRLLGLRVTLLCRKLFWLAVLMLPAAVQAVIPAAVTKSGAMAENIYYLLITGLAATAFIGWFFFYCVVQRYSLAEELFCAADGMSASAAIRKSIQMTNGSCVQQAFFRLSFIPWFALCICIIPCVYVVPYYKTACAIFRRRLSSPSANMVKIEEKPIIFGKPKPFSLDIKNDI
jgi:hypothetical protein